jgi:uncharacterized coiled-coil protein SlyX
MMLVTLGVLLASLIALAVAPAYRRRIARLTSEEIRRSLPVTEAEIKADKDRLRAQFAIRVHKLEAQNEQQRLAAARQLVELNRRDAEIAKLQGEIEAIKSELEESGNARRVLEHTVTDSLPKLEQRLAEARQLLSQRDREINELNGETMRSVRALDEAMQINAQQRQEIDRMAIALNTRAAVSRDGPSDPRFDGEVAYRAELEALRAKARDQASLIGRLQGGADAASGNGSADGRAMAETERLKQDLAEAETALRSARGNAEAGAADRAAEARVAGLQAKIDDQAAEIAQLKAALEAYQGGEEADRSISLKDSRLAAKARISSLQAQVTQQLVTIQRLRAVVASGNERLARQAAHFMDEMRRLGAGKLPASAEARRGRDPGSPRRSLSERISNAKPALAAKLVPSKKAGDTAATQREASAERATDRSKVSEYLKALSDPEADMPEARRAQVAENPTPSERAQEAVAPAPAESKPAKSRFRLMERITGIGKG